MNTEGIVLHLHQQDSQLDTRGVVRATHFLQRKPMHTYERHDRSDIIL